MLKELYLLDLRSYYSSEIIIIFDDPNKMDLKFLKKIINYKKTKILVNKKKQHGVCACPLNNLLVSVLL